MFLVFFRTVTLCSTIKELFLQIIHDNFSYKSKIYVLYYDRENN